MKIVVLKSFDKDQKKLPKEVKEQLLKKLLYLETNINHPSLRAKKIQGYEDIWEVSITMTYRITFHRDIVHKIICLRRIGTHAILKKP
jgi:mRNA interferase RelE/StbE